VTDNPLPDHESRRLWAVSGGDPDRYRRLAAERIAGAPLQYLEGTAPFGPLDLVVDERVLVPRPETEQLWELAVRLSDRPAVVVDLCTGSGALALACKTSWPGARVVGTDLSPDAVEVARLNAGRLALDVEFVVGDLFGALAGDLEGRIDLLVANPPYVASSEWATLPADVRREPRMALVAGAGGMDVIDRIGAGCPRWLSAGGRVVCEIGERQSDPARAAFSGLAEVEVHRDLAGRHRFVTGVRA
jgi:release factor glutamine methyltransferase